MSRLKLGMARVIVVVAEVRGQGSHYRNNPPSSRDKLYYGRDAWCKIEADLNAVVGFRARDQTTITNKWDALLKNYK